MAYKNPRKQEGRAQRFPLHFPVYFRLPDSLTWSEGTTENISYTGVLFHSTSPLALECTIELRLQVKGAVEIRGKGVVVRLEPREAPETPIVLAVAMRDARMSNPSAMGDAPRGPQVH